MKGRDALREMMSGTPTESAAVPAKRSSGAVRAMSLELQQLGSEAAAAKSLREQLANGEVSVELQGELIDASLVTDRIPTEHDPAFDELKSAIADNGQQVPILVRPHPETKGRYQIAYGRRRLRAALELGRPVKAFVRQLSDRELIIAQAQENGPRADLSFIERALFAANLNGHGFDRDTVSLALGVDKPELSRLFTVASGITPALITAIGPAPKIGRPRWLALAEKLTDASALKRARKVTEQEVFLRADTNARFNQVLAAVSSSSSGTDRRSALSTPKGRAVGWVEKSKKGLRLSTDEPAFAAFIEKRLPALIQEFEAEEARTDTGDEKGGH
ncbi:ParB family chromosome partitioning protein [Mesorhizobium sp. YL-MeA3-2017]|jgi:ParB family chromosome partitioning protein|uniref:plasmid partitioning protein RepB n=1 Tax=Mesorhizobium sp. YL-MeA3-2017 TaxID=3042284 RepID=UPI0015C9861E|nr:plasmid partitioning protein RepB [Mesorhizobium sp. YL-MeA3-2017]MDQ0333515.1 ParB family chromosome partitioning protein [Mesorhizobium sp. YL-MeA3-2017]